MARDLVVLSLCDGMSCGRIALERAGIGVKAYYASEIKEVGIQVTMENWGDRGTVEIGDVNKVSYKDGVLHTEKGDFQTGKIDLVIFGSPCQSVSIAMKTEHRIGLADKKKSGLFYECIRILNEVKPDYFFMENVASMPNDVKDEISKTLGVDAIHINSSVVAPALRDRYYWTNIPNVPEIEKKEVNLQEVLTDGYTNRTKAHCLTVTNSRPAVTPVKLFHRYYAKGFDNLVFKSKEHFEACADYYDTHYKGMSADKIPTHETDIFDGLRVLNQTELERCQTVPEGYTKCLTRNKAADVLGDGWTVDVIAHFFKALKEVL